MKTAAALERYYVLPCCLLLLNLCNLRRLSSDTLSIRCLSRRRRRGLTSHVNHRIGRLLSGQLAVVRIGVLPAQLRIDIARPAVLDVRQRAGNPIERLRFIIAIALIDDMLKHLDGLLVPSGAV